MINHVDVSEFNDLKYDIVEEFKENLENLNVFLKDFLKKETEDIEEEITEFINVNYFDTWSCPSWINADILIEEIIEELDSEL